MKFPCVKHKSIISKKLSLFPSPYVGASAHASVYRYMCLNIELPQKTSHFTITHVRLLLSCKDQCVL